MTNLVFTRSAQRDLERLHSFILQHSPSAAGKFSLRIRQSIGTVSLSPEIGRPIETFTGVREFIAGKYIIRYIMRIEDDTLIVLRIWHGKEKRS